MNGELTPSQLLYALRSNYGLEKEKAVERIVKKLGKEKDIYTDSDYETLIHDLKSSKYYPDLPPAPSHGLNAMFAGDDEWWLGDNNV